MALLDEDEWFLPHIEEALKSIFKSFDKDEDGALSPAELEAFSVATNGKKFDANTLNEIKEYFDVRDDGSLTQQGFLEMYQLQTMSEPDETIKDLIKHGKLIL